MPRRRLAALSDPTLVACVHCGTAITRAQADVVATGYRCAPCSAAAAALVARGADDPDLWDPADLVRARRVRRRNRWLAIGSAAAIVTALVTLRLLTDPGVTAGVIAITLLASRIGMLVLAGPIALARWRLRVARERRRLPAARVVGALPAPYTPELE